MRVVTWSGMCLAVLSGSLLLSTPAQAEEICMTYPNGAISCYEGGAGEPLPEVVATTGTTEGSEPAPVQASLPAEPAPEQVSLPNQPLAPAVQPSASAPAQTQGADATTGTGPVEVQLPIDVATSAVTSTQAASPTESIRPTPTESARAAALDAERGAVSSGSQIWLFAILSGLLIAGIAAYCFRARSKSTRRRASGRHST